MPQQRPPSHRCLTLAAEMRMGGSTWEAIAARLRRSPETVRKWPREYPDLWRLVTSEAERRLATEAEGEAVVVLRQLLGSDDAKIRWHAAKALVRLRVELTRLELRRLAKSADQPTRRGAVPPPAQPPGTVTIEQVAQMLRDKLHRAPDGEPAPADPPAGDRPSPQRESGRSSPPPVT